MIHQLRGFPDECHKDLFLCEGIVIQVNHQSSGFELVVLPDRNCPISLAIDSSGLLSASFGVMTWRVRCSFFGVVGIERGVDVEPISPPACECPLNGGKLS